MKDLVARAAGAISAAILAGRAEPGPTFFGRADDIARYILTGERPE